MSQEHYQFADLQWQSRWNDPTKPRSCLLQCGPELVATGPMGVLRLDLRRSADTVAVVEQLRAFAKALEATQRRYTAFEEYLKDPEAVWTGDKDDDN